MLLFFIIRLYQELLYRLLIGKKIPAAENSVSSLFHLANSTGRPVSTMKAHPQVSPDTKSDMQLNILGFLVHSFLLSAVQGHYCRTEARTDLWSPLGCESAKRPRLPFLLPPIVEQSSNGRRDSCLCLWTWHSSHMSFTLPSLSVSYMSFPFIKGIIRCHCSNLVCFPFRGIIGSECKSFNAFS